VLTIKGIFGRFGIFWFVVGRFGSFWVRCGWLWVVVDGCGSFWVILGRFGWFRVLVATNRELRRQVCKLISQPGGMGVFNDQLSETWESSDSLMYMADILRESGAIKQALQLVNRACQLSPQDPSICLYLVHTYEIVNEHNKAFLEARAFLERNHCLKIGNLPCSQFVPFFQQVTEDIYLNNASVNFLPTLMDQEDVGKLWNLRFAS
jgi:hypothetical protein